MKSPILAASLWVLLTAFLSAPEAMAMARPRPGHLAGSYVLESCEGGVTRIALPSDDQHVYGGTIDDFVGYLQIGQSLELAQDPSAVRLSYGGASANLALGDAHLSGPTQEIGGETSVDQTVSWGSDGQLEVATDARYTYVPVISVWNTKANWSISRSAEGDLQIAFDESGQNGKLHAACLLKATITPRARE